MSQRVMIIDLENFLDTRIVDTVFTERGIGIARPRDREAVEAQILRGTSGEEPSPDLILVLYYTGNQLKWLLPLLRRAEEKGLQVVNTAANLTLFSNYPLRSQELAQHGFSVPESYHGRPSGIPASLGDMVVWKSQQSRLTILCPRTGIHSLEEDVYVEERVPNPEKRVLTLYWVAGCLYARWKEDPLLTSQRTRTLVSDLGSFGDEVASVRRVASTFGLTFFNVEFIGGRIIDVNTIANIFYPEHRDPLNVLAQWITEQSR